MYSMLVRVDQIMDAQVVSCHFYEVTDDGRRTLLATREDWLDTDPQDDLQDSLSMALKALLRWSVLTSQRHQSGS